MPHLKTPAIVVIVTLLTASADAQQRKSFSERIAMLGIPWGGDEQEEQQPQRHAQQARTHAPARSAQAQPQRAPQQTSREPQPYGIAHRLPGLDPRNLIPDDFFGASEESRMRASGGSQGPSGAGGIRAGRSNMGATRSRLLRDLRSGGQPSTAARAPATATSNAPRAAPAANVPRATVVAPETSASQPTVLSQRSTARAGSVLSDAPPRNQAPAARANQPTETPPAPDQVGPAVSAAPAVRRDLLTPFSREAKRTPPKRASSDVAKSVAAAVAESLAETETDASADTGPQPTPATPPSAAEDEPSTGPAISQPQVAGRSPAAPEPEQENAQPLPSGGPLAMGAAPPETTEQAKDAPGDQPSWQTAGASPSASGAQEDRAQTSGARAFDDQGPALTPGDDWASSGDAPAVAAAPRAAKPNDATLLMSQKTPLIVSRVSGPKQITIGREAHYRVIIANRGDMTADQLVARVDLPAWVEVVGSSSSVGAVDPPAAQEESTAVLWRMAELAPGNTHQLDLRLVARQGKPIELGVNWKHAPVGTRAVVEVQEPKLNLSIDGPDDVLYGAPERYRLNLTNPGTGVAENVVVLLLPPSGAASEATSYKVGDLKPNESRSLKVQLTAREAGRLAIQARATAAGGLDVATDKSVFCRKPELEVDWRGPSRRFAGVDATYYFRVRNPGTATAEGVEFRVDLPAGFSVAKTSGGGEAEESNGRLVWRVGSLRPGDDYYMELKGSLHEPGANKFALSAEASGGIASASAAMATEVTALADLKLNVRDPQGPVAVGEDAVYEVRVTNRGAAAARSIDIAGLFSQGIEPYAVEGGEYSIADGRVSIRTIDRLPVDGELVIKIHAKAESPGTHVFRAEALCRDLDIKLAAEETTRFYVEERLSMEDSKEKFE